MYFPSVKNFPISDTIFHYGKPKSLGLGKFSSLQRENNFPPFMKQLLASSSIFHYGKFFPWEFIFRKTISLGIPSPENFFPREFIFRKIFSLGKKFSRKKPLHRGRELTFCLKWGKPDSQFIWNFINRNFQQWHWNFLARCPQEMSSMSKFFDYIYKLNFLFFMKIQAFLIVKYPYFEPFLKYILIWSMLCHLLTSTNHQCL